MFSLGSMRLCVGCVAAIAGAPADDGVSSVNTSAPEAEITGRGAGTRGMEAAANEEAPTRNEEFGRISMLFDVSGRCSADAPKALAAEADDAAGARKRCRLGSAGV